MARLRLSRKGKARSALQRLALLREKRERRSRGCAGLRVGMEFRQLDDWANCCCVVSFQPAAFQRVSLASPVQSSPMAGPPARPRKNNSAASLDRGTSLASFLQSRRLAHSRNAKHATLRPSNGQPQQRREPAKFLSSSRQAEGESRILRNAFRLPLDPCLLNYTFQLSSSMLIEVASSGGNSSTCASSTKSLQSATPRESPVGI
jgi:hypothetical protein